MRPAQPAPPSVENGPTVSPHRWRRGTIATVLGVALTFGAVPALDAAAAPSVASAPRVAAADAATWGGNSANTLGGNDYYLDATLGDDTNAGTSAAAAWKTLAKANATTFQPGDRILLKAGETWSGQQLWPKGSGSDGKPIEVDAYGSSTSRPYIATNGNVPSPFTSGTTKNPQTVGLSGAVVLRNQQYWTIQNLDLSNDDDFSSNITTGSYVRDGVSVSINADLLPAGADSIMRGITVQNISVHNTDGPSTWQKIYYAGIDFQVFGSKQWTEYGSGGYHFEDVVIRNNSFKDVELNAIQFGFNWFGDAQGTTDSTGKFHEGWEQLWIRDQDMYSRNVYIGHNYAESIGQGVYQFAGTKNLVAEYNEGNGWLQRYDQVSAGLYLWAGADSVMRYNEIYDGPANQYDATPWDLEFTNFNVTYEKNYSHDNLGGWMSYMGNSGNSIARYNLSVNDNGVIWKNMLSTNYSPTYVNNNVFVYDGSKLASFHDEVLKDKVYFFNNIFYNTSKTTPTTWFRKPGALAKGIFTNNAYFEAGGVASSQQPADAQAVTADPQFVGDPAAYLKDAGVDRIQDAAAIFQLKPTSPLIDAGRYNPRLGATDFAGTDLYYGTAPDIGLDETTVGTQVTNPVDTDPIENIGVDTRTNLALNKPSTASSTHPADNFTRLAAGKAVDGDPSTRWAAADSPDYPLTFDIDFGAATKFDEVDIDEFIDSNTDARIAGYALQRWDAATNKWVTFKEGNGVGAAKVIKDFGSVTSSKLRLSIAGLLPGQTYGPTINEIKVFDNGTTSTPATVTPTTATHDRNPARAGDPANQVTFDVTANGDTLEAIRYVTTSGALVGSLDAGDYVATTDGAVTHYRLTPAFYADKLLGESGLVFDFTNSPDVRVAVTITESVSDTIKPVATAAISAGRIGRGGWYISPVTVKGFATDNVDDAPRVQIAVDSGAFTNAGQVVVSTNGRHVVRIRAVDAAGNVSAIVTKAVSIDSVAPRVTWSASPATRTGTPRNPVVLQARATDVTSGVAKLQYRLGSAAWRSVVGSVTLARPGTSMVSFRAIDRAGNASAVSSTKVIIAANTPTSISASPKTVKRGAATTVRLAGFHSYRVVDLFVGSTRIASPRTDVNGLLRVGVRITAAPGSVAVRAVERGAAPVRATTVIRVVR